MAQSAMLDFRQFRQQELAAVSRPVGLMSVCIGSTAILRTVIMGLSAGMHPTRLMHEVVSVAVYPSLLCLPAAMVHSKQFHLLQAACIFSHIVRSLALWAVGLGWVPNSGTNFILSCFAEGIRHILTLHVELLLEVALGFQDLLNLSVMAVLHAMRQLGWMSVAYWREGGGLQQTVVRGLINWAVMMAMTTLMEMRCKKRYDAYRASWLARQQAAEVLAAPSRVRTPLPSPKKEQAADKDAGQASSGGSGRSPPSRTASGGIAGATLLLPEPITTAVATERSEEPAMQPAASATAAPVAAAAAPRLAAALQMHAERPPQPTGTDQLWPAERREPHSAPARIDAEGVPYAGTAPAWHGVAKPAATTAPPAITHNNSSRHVTTWHCAEPADACGTAAYSHRDAYHGHSWLLPCETQSLLDGMLIGPVGMDDADLSWVPCLSAPSLAKTSATPGTGKGAPTGTYSSRVAAAAASSSRSSTFNSSKPPSMDGLGAMGKLSGLSDLADQPELLSMSTQHSEQSGGQRLAAPQLMVVQQLMRLVAAEKQQPYVSRQQQATVRVKMRGMEPQQLPSDLAMQLQSYLRERDPRLLVRGVSLRRGCVVMTLDMLLLGQEEGPIQQAAEHELLDHMLATVSDVIHTNAAGAALPHGSSLSIQTPSQLSLNSWDTHTGSFVPPSKMETCATRPSSDTHSSFTATTITNLSEIPGSSGSGRFLEVPDSDSAKLPALATWGAPGSTSLGSGSRSPPNDLDVAGAQLTALSSSSLRSLAAMQLPPLPQLPTQRVLSPRTALSPADPTPTTNALVPQCFMLSVDRTVHMAGPGPADVVSVQLQLIVPANSMLKGWDLEAQQPGTPLDRGPCSASAHIEAEHVPPTTLLLLARTSGGPNLHLVVSKHEAVQDITLHTRHAGCISMLQLRVQVDIHLPSSDRPPDSPRSPTGLMLELWTRLQLSADNAPALPLEVMQASVPLMVFPQQLAAAADELCQYLQSQGGVRPAHALVRSLPTALANLAAGSSACEDARSMGPAALLEDIGTVCASLDAPSKFRANSTDARYADVADWAEGQHAKVMYSMCEDLLVHTVKHAMPIMANMLVAIMQHNAAALQAGLAPRLQTGALDVSIPGRAPCQWLLETSAPASRTADVSEEIMVATASGNEPGPPLVAPRTSLLHAAMLSNSPPMLHTVLRWGLEHGGSGWEWPWQLQDASGCTALHVLALQPQCTAMLHVLTDTLSDEQQRAAYKVWLHESSGVGMSPVQLYAASEYAGAAHPSIPRWPAHMQARQLLTAIPSGLPDEVPSGDENLLSDSDLPAVPVLPEPLHLHPGPDSMRGRADWRSALSLKSVFGLLQSQSGLLRRDPPEYRGWIQQQLRPIILAWCSYMALMMIACLWRAAHMGHLLKDAPTLVLCMGGYLPLAFIVRNKGDWQGWWLPICWMRATSWLLAASTHVPTNWASILTMHVEVVHEVLLVAMVEEMDVVQLLPARLCLWVAYSAGYHAVGHSYPVIRSLMLNLTSALVSMAMRAWRLRTFMQIQPRLPISPQASSFMSSSKHSSFESASNGDFPNHIDGEAWVGPSRASGSRTGSSTSMLRSRFAPANPSEAQG